MRGSSVIVVGVLFGALLVGCNFNPRTSEMVPGSIDIARKHSGSLYVEATGGRPNGGFAGPYLDNPEFKQAIEQAVLKCQVFSSIAPASASDYTLSVNFDSDAPAAGLNMTVDHRARWKLIQTKSQRALLDEQ